MEKVYEIYIRTTPERLWRAITDHDERRKFQFGMTITSDWKVGAPLIMEHAGAPGLLCDGEILELDPPHRLVTTYRALWSDEVKAAGTSRVTWEINQIGDTCCLLLTHDELPADANNQIYGGWPMILSGLKTWIESGDVLTTPGSLMYAEPAR